MAKTKRRSVQSTARKLARKPFGPWEERDASHFSTWRPAGPKWRPECYVNNRYSVQFSDHETSWGPVLHLWIRRHDDQMPRSWADLQRIKNELVGEQRVAVEVFPEADCLHDSANMAHLWILPEGFILPFTL
jgi:hypothetical protein